MKEKEIKKQVKLLAKQKKFEQIYLEYGPKYFRKYVSRKYKKEDIAKLEEEGKFLDIYTKYGKDYWEYVWVSDAEKELGRKLTWKELFFHKNFIVEVGKPIKRIVITLIASLSAISLLSPPIEQEKEEAKNAKKYAKEIGEYEKAIKEYAKKFDIHSQSDMEIIMRIMKDMHETIQGYGEPKLDINGYLGIDVMDKDGIGVCRNMAANMVDKLNAINPEYNARFVTLWDYGGDLQTANIELNRIQENGTRINIKGNVQKTYSDEELQEETITEENKTITYQYEEGKIERKIIAEENQSEEISYDENGKVLEHETTITKQQEGNEIQKNYVDGKLIRENKKTSDYYTSKLYDETGKVKIETLADKESEVTTFYRNGKLNFKEIVKDGEKTTIYYDENGKEEKREIEETDGSNIFLELEETEKLVEKIGEDAKKQQKEELINHAIVAMDIPKEKLTLLIDPTNPSIGIYKNGKIEMFNETKPEEAIRDRNIEGDTWFEGIEGLVDYPMDYVKSFIEPTLSEKELEEKYGLEAQNKMLEKIEKEDKKNTFKQGLKIDKGITYDFDTNTVTIDEAERDK